MIHILCMPDTFIISYNSMNKTEQKNKNISYNQALSRDFFEGGGKIHIDETGQTG